MRALKNIDVAFLCMIRLPYTMTTDEAAGAVMAFHPKIVIPYHYQSKPEMDLNSFKREIGGDWNCPRCGCWIGIRLS